MGALITAGTLTLPVASFKYTTFDGQSEIQLGYVDSTAYTGTLTPHPLVTTANGDNGSYSNWWTVSMTSFSYGTTDINSDLMTEAIVDTGTSLLILSDGDYGQFVE